MNDFPGLQPYDGEAVAEVNPYEGFDPGCDDDYGHDEYDDGVDFLQQKQGGAADCTYGSDETCNVMVFEVNAGMLLGQQVASLSDGKLATKCGSDMLASKLPLMRFSDDTAANGEDACSISQPGLVADKVQAGLVPTCQGWGLVMKGRSWSLV